MTAYSHEDHPVALRSPPSYRFLGFPRSDLLINVIFALLVVLVAVPIVPVVLQSFVDRPLYEEGGVFSLDGYRKLFVDASFGKVVLNTALFAILSTVFALLIAVPMAVLIIKTDVPFRRFFDIAMQWPFFISALVLAFGWILIYSPAGFISKYTNDLLGVVPWNLYSIPGMAFVQAVGLAPIAYLYCANSLRQSDTSLEAASRTIGATPLQTLRYVVLPMLRPPVVYSAILILTMSIEALSVPLLLGLPNGIRMFSSFLYEYGLTSIDPDYSVLGAASVLTLLVLASLLIVQRIVLKKSARFVSVRGKVPRRHALNLGWIRWLAFAIIVVYLMFGTLAPLIALVLRSFTQVFTPLINPFSVLTLENYRQLFSVPAFRDPIGVSLIVSTIGAIAIGFFALLVAMVAHRSSYRFGRMAETFTLAMLAIPGTVLSIGFFWAFSIVPRAWGIAAGSILSLIVAFGVRALPVAFASVSSAMMQIHREVDHAARVVGADWFGAFCRVLLGLLRPAVVSAMLLTFVIMMKEYATAVFLVTADTQVIGSALLSLWAQGSTGPVSALAVVQVIITTLVALGVGALMKWRQDA